MVTINVLFYCPNCATKFWKVYYDPQDVTRFAFCPACHNHLAKPFDPDSAIKPLTKEDTPCTPN